MDGRSKKAVETEAGACGVFAWMPPGCRISASLVIRDKALNARRFLLHFIAGADIGLRGIHGRAGKPATDATAGTPLCALPESRALPGYGKLRQHGVPNRWREERSIAHRE
jgi:hypothetical protein